MECLLIGGAQSVGKSGTIYRLANDLVSRGFSVSAGSIPARFSDFKAILIGFNKSGDKITIIINSPTDTVDIINDFKKFYDDNGGVYDILISSIRDDDFWPRNDFFKIMNITSAKNFILEIPLAKITRRTTNLPIALRWYRSQIDNLINHTLTNNPFNL